MSAFSEAELAYLLGERSLGRVRGKNPSRDGANEERWAYR